MNITSIKIWAGGTVRMVTLGFFNFGSDVRYF
jgi:hypothetical protein